jgi:hypothetical protein
MSPSLIPLALVGALLAVSALAKLARPPASARALAWIVPRPSLRVLSLGGLVLLEAALVAAIVLALVGSISALPVALVVAALLAGAAGLLAQAVLAGRTGEPCGCFGAKGTIGWPAVARAGGTAIVALLALVPADSIAWLAVGVVLALCACAALAAMSLALAREVGELRIALAGDVALEIADEGPTVGIPASGWPSDAFAPADERVLQVAVFTSEGCAMCHRVAPAVDHLAKDPRIDLVRFDEVADGPVWAGLGVPGSPFAIVADPEATPFAKGTFNSMSQLESIIATAESRRSEHLKRGANA